METRSERLGQQDWKAWPDVDGAEQTLSYDQYSEYFNTNGTVYYWRVVAVDANGTAGMWSQEGSFVFNRQEPQDTPSPTRPRPTAEPTLTVSSPN